MKIEAWCPKCKKVETLKDAIQRDETAQHKPALVGICGCGIRIVRIGRY